MSGRDLEQAIKATIPGKPVPCPRPRVSRHGTFYPLTYTDWLEEARWILRDACVKQNGGRRLEGPLRARLVFAGAHGSADIDNLVKSVLDAAQGAMFDNDRQVTELAACKVAGEPRTEIEIGPV